MRFQGLREVKPTGWRVVVKPDPVEEVTASGIVLQIDVQQQRAAGVVGTLVSIGPSAWKDYKGLNGEPWAFVGDRVIFNKYAGAFIDDGSKDGLMLVNDEDIQALVIKEEKDAG